LKVYRWVILLARKQEEKKKVRREGKPSQVSFLRHNGRLLIGGESGLVKGQKKDDHMLSKTIEGFRV